MWAVMWLCLIVCKAIIKNIQELHNAPVTPWPTDCTDHCGTTQIPLFESKQF